MYRADCVSYVNTKASLVVGGAGLRTTRNTVGGARGVENQAEGRDQHAHLCSEAEILGED